MRLTVAGPYTAYLMSLAPLGTLPRQDVRGETMRPLDEMIALQVETDNNGEGWTDTTTPRTERPVRFYPKGRPAPYPGPTDVCVEQAYGTSFRVSDAIRVF